MVYSVAIVDSFSGLVLHRPLADAGSWQSFINGIGSGSTAFRLRDEQQPTLARETWRDITEPWARTIVVSYRDRAVYAGLIDGRAWDRDAGVLTVTHQELRGLLRKRLSSDLPRFRANGALLIEQRSLRGVLRDVLAYALRDAPGSIWQMPVDVGTVDGGGYTYKWPHTKFDAVDAIIAELTDTAGGPDLWLQPRWAEQGRFDWRAIIGTPRVPGSRLEFHLGAETHPVSGLKERDDGARQLTGVFALGEGSEADMLVGRAGAFAGPNIPAMDGTASFKAVADKAHLDALAAATLSTFRKPTTSQTYGLLLEHVDLGGTLNLGARPVLYSPGDEFMLPGERPAGYVVSLSGNLTSSAIGLEVHPL